MAFSKRSRRGADRVVRYKQRDGSIKEYRYPAYQAKPLPKRPDTIRALADAWKDSPEWRDMAKQTKTTYSIYLRPLEDLGDTEPAAIKRRDILAIRDALAAASGNAAANYFVTVARQLFNWAISRDRLEVNPAAKIDKLETGHLRAWDQAQADTALRLLPEHLRRVVVLGMHTGQRRGDLCAMTWADYDGTRIRVTQQKTGRRLIVPAHPNLQDELDAWREGADPSVPNILINHEGKAWRPNNLSYHMPAALGRIGLPADLNVHGLRKLAAANLAEAGCSTKEIAAITGHETLAMVELYTKSADQERLATAAVRRLQNFYKNKTHEEN